MDGGRVSILVVDDDPHHVSQLRYALEGTYDVAVAGDRKSAIAALDRVRPDLVLLDLCLPPDNVPEEGFRVLDAALAPGRDTLVVVMTGLEEREPALRAVAGGAYDFFGKPVDVATLKVVLARATERLALERENRRLRAELQSRFHVDGMIGASAPMVHVFEAIRRVADVPVNVLVTGESGTGKELVARAIHFGGTRKNGPFVAVHCAALPEALVESELFGHERGAFTGADTVRVGRFEAAHGGTLFLDEVSTLPSATQVKLLRVLETRSVERLGSNLPRPVDIRVVAATNEDLEARIRQGTFREDLYYRIAGFPIRLPPLRERAEDVPLLADYFLRRLHEERRGGPARLGPEAREELMRRRWPGNVRELMHVIENVALTVDAEVIRPEHLPPVPDDVAFGQARLPTTGDFKRAMLEFERDLVRSAIDRAGGVKARAARELGLDAAQMKYLVRKHHF